MAIDKIKQAKSIYNDIKSYFNSKKLNYTPDDQKLVIKSGFNTNDFPVEFIMTVDTDRELVFLYSKMTFIVPEDKRVDMAIAICAANSHLANGCFDYDISTGTIIFRMVNSFANGSKLDATVYDYIVSVSVSTVDKYNDKFFMLSKNMITLEKFLDECNN